MSIPLSPTLPEGVRADRVHTARGEFATLVAGDEGRLVLMVPRKRLCVIDGAGHPPAVERPSATVASLTDFWASLSRAGVRTGSHARAS